MTSTRVRVRTSSTLIAFALGALTTITTASGCDYDPALDDPATPARDAMNHDPSVGPRRRMTCTTGLPSITVEDEVHVVATCPKDEKSMKVTISCPAPPLVAKTDGEEIIVVCPEETSQPR